MSIVSNRRVELEDGSTREVVTVSDAETGEVLRTFDRATKKEPEYDFKEIDLSDFFDPEDDLGFVNLHTSNAASGQNKGDGKWYPLDSENRTQHDGEPVMTRTEAQLQGIEVG